MSFLGIPGLVFVLKGFIVDTGIKAIMDHKKIAPTVCCLVFYLVNVTIQIDPVVFYRIK